MDPELEIANTLKKIAEVQKESASKTNKEIEKVADALNYHADAVHRLCDIVEDYLNVTCDEFEIRDVRRGADELSRKRRISDQPDRE